MPDLVADRTRTRVERVISHLGYEPSEAAQSLSRRRRDRLGILLGSATDAEALRLASACARAIDVRNASSVLRFVPARGALRQHYLRRLSGAPSLDGAIDLGAQLSLSDARQLGHTEATLLRASRHPLLGAEIGRRLGALPSVRAADIVVAVGEARDLSRERFRGLAETAPRVIARWHDGSFAGAAVAFAEQMPLPAQRSASGYVAYVALDAVSAGAGAVMLDRHPLLLPLICAVPHALADARQTIVLPGQAEAIATVLVDTLLAQLSRA